MYSTRGNAWSWNYDKIRKPEYVRSTTRANHGEQIMTEAFENDLNIESVKGFCDGGDAKLLSLEVCQLNAKWDS